MFPVIESAVGIVGNQNKPKAFTIHYTESQLIITTLASYNDKTRFTITNIQGQLVESYSPTNQSFEINKSEFANGIYFINMIAKRSRYCQKVIIN